MVETEENNVLKHNTEHRTQSLEFLRLFHLGP